MFGIDMTFFEFLSRLDEGVLVVAVVMIMIIVTSVTGIIAKVWFRHRKLQIEADLKMEMIGRGMSADEISQVLKATLSESLTGSPAKPQQ